MNKFLKDCEYCEDNKAVFLKHTYSGRPLRWFCEKCSLIEKESDWRCPNDAWEKLDLTKEASGRAKKVIEGFNSRRHELLDLELERDLDIEETKELLGLQRHYEEAVSVAYPVDRTVVDRLMNKLDQIQARLTDDDDDEAEDSTTCGDCGGFPPIWVRQTQFAGNHYFCQMDAEKQKDFQSSHPSYYQWKKIL